MAAPHAGMTELIDGHFQDANGAALNLGYIIMQLNQDAQSSQPSQVDGGRTVKITLDANGSADAGQYVWPNTALNPSTTYYIVNVYSASGQLVWGPQYMLVDTAPTFDLDGWVPDQVGSGGTPVGSITLQTNGVNNGSQQLFNAQQGTNMTISDDGMGTITFAASGSSGPRSRIWNGWTPDGSDGLNPGSGYGCTVDGSNSGTGAAYVGLPPTATTNKMLRITSGTDSSNINFVSSSGNTNTANDAVSIGILGLAEIRSMLGGTTTIRSWVGLGRPKSQVNFYKSDAPPIPVVGFRYSSGTDTKWTCVVTDGSTQVTADSGIAVDALPHTFGIEVSGTNFLFFMDGVQVASVSYATTTLTTASGFQLMMTVDNNGTSNAVTNAVEMMYWDTTT